MQALKAHVKNGRLVLDEPTTLPEGAEVRLSIVEDDDFGDGERPPLHEMTVAERVELENAIEEGAADFEHGDFADARDFALHLAAKP